MSSGRLLRPAWKFRKLTSPWLGYRTFLSEAYRCDDVWSSRLSSPLLKSINASEFAYELNRKYKREGKVSAVDIDLFVNHLESSHAQDMLDDMEELVTRLRRSPETIHTFPSTAHATLRLLLDIRKTKLLLKFLDNPLEFGIFADHYMSNLLMDTYLKEKNYTAAARVASKLMLQEDFGPPLTQALAIASCYSYINSEENLPWEDYTVRLEEPKEEVMIKIPYLRNPYFDDHFDLKEPKHIVGKTLAWGAPLIGGEIGTNCEILGWALYNKWDHLANALHSVTKGNLPVAASVMNSVKEIVNSGESENREEILALIGRLESDSSKVVEVDLESLIHDFVQKKAAKVEADDIKAQEQTYASWEKIRGEEVQNQIQEYRKKQLMAEIEEKKKILKAKEEVIYFFENKDKLDMLLDRKPKVRVRDNIYFFPHRRKTKRKQDEDYIPPEAR